MERDSIFLSLKSVQINTTSCMRMIILFMGVHNS